MPFASIPARNLDVFYEARGSGDPVVLIGGFTSTVATWGRQVGLLSERFRVIALDNRGSGRTRVIDDDGVRSPVIWSDDVAAFCDQLALPAIHLVGVSMGGVIAQAFATQHESRLRSLTLMCTTPGGDHAPAVPLDVLQGVVRGSQPDPTDDDIDALARAVAHPETRTKRREAWECFLATRLAESHTVDEMQRRQAGLRGFTAWDELANLSVPTLVMTGSDDRLVPPENSRALADRIPGAELQIIHDGGHIFFVEQSHAVNQALLAFLSCH